MNATLSSGAAWLVSAGLLVTGCAGETAPTPDEGGAGGVPASCPKGQVAGYSDTCTPAGIQGCADVFVEDDGLCHPSMTKCPVGTIPKFDEGCIPVGIARCADVFVEDDGLCHPRMDKCPDGTIAVPQEGCVPLDGPEGCGTGTWGNVPDAPDSVYVDPSFAVASSDGSRELPETTLAGALSRVRSGGRIVLAAGTYDEAMLLRVPMEVVGRCPSMVRVQGSQLVPPIAFSTVLAVVGVPVTLRGLTVAGAEVAIDVSQSRVPRRSHRPSSADSASPSRESS